MNEVEKARKNKKKKPYHGTQTVMRAMAILNMFTDEQPEWALADLAEAVDLNRTTTYRLLTALESTDMVVRNNQNDAQKYRYRLGSGAIVLGGRALRASSLRAITRPELGRLAAKTGETVTLEILNGDQTLMLDEEKGSYMVGMLSSVGNRWPAHASSTGKVLLAYLPEPDLVRILPDELPPITSNTITGRGAFMTLLGEVRTQGYAITRDELEIGYSDLAVPLFNAAGQAVAALAIGGATPRFTPERCQEILPWLTAAAGVISHQLGYRMKEE